MNTTKPTLLATANLSAGAQLPRGIHIRPPAECECGHDHGGLPDHIKQHVAQLFGVSIPEEPKRQKYAQNGGVTIAYQIDPETRKINVGFAVCSDEDGYNNKFGFNLAKDRIHERDLKYSFSLDFDEIVHVTKVIYQEKDGFAGFSKSFVERIGFDDLSNAAVEYVIGAAMAVRKRELAMMAREELEEKRHEQEYKRAEKKRSVAQKAALMAETLHANDQTPPIQ